MTTNRTTELGRHNFWEELFTLRDQERERMKTAIQVIKRNDLPQEMNRQGVMRWYMHPGIKDVVLSTLMVFEQEIPPGGRSGRLRFQGGQVIFIIEGRGHTLIDGVQYKWEAEDVLNLPLKPNGIVVQHFNGDPDKPARFLATEVNWVDCTGMDRGSGFEQLEDAPNYQR